MKNKYNKPKKIGKENSFSPVKTGYNNAYPVFAFNYIEIGQRNKIFSFRDNRIKSNEFGMLFENLKKMSQKTWGEIKSEKLQWHAHEVEWESTAIPKGFSNLPEKIQYFPAFQFKVLKEKRIFGFFRSDNVFEIVWLDYDHEIYKNEKFN